MSSKLPRYKLIILLLLFRSIVAIQIELFFVHKTQMLKRSNHVIFKQVLVPRAISFQSALRVMKLTVTRNSMLKLMQQTTVRKYNCSLHTRNNYLLWAWVLLYLSVLFFLTIELLAKGAYFTCVIYKYVYQFLFFLKENIIIASNRHCLAY